jgi:ATP synthase protein I
MWQLLATAAMGAAAAVLSDLASALSAAAGGGVSIIAGLASAVVASRSAKSAGEVVVGALGAEALKIGLAVLLSWLVLANCDRAVVPAFLGALVVTMLIFAMAFFVRDY